jgi:hypothetical protein
MILNCGHCHAAIYDWKILLRTSCAFYLTQAFNARVGCGVQNELSTTSVTNSALRREGFQ